MKKYLLLFMFVYLTQACEEQKEISSISPENWLMRKADISQEDSLSYGKSYLSIYSQIYSLSEHKTHNLTAMVSLRNTIDLDTIYILKAQYFNTHGQNLRNYFDHPIFLAPLKTVEIIIDETDVSGGTGSNF